MAQKLNHPTAAETHSAHKLWAQQALYGRLPAHAVASITADNGSELSTITDSLT
jgi:IS30 family transposase